MLIYDFKEGAVHIITVELVLELFSFMSYFRELLQNRKTDFLKCHYICIFSFFSLYVSFSSGVVELDVISQFQHFKR